MITVTGWAISGGTQVLELLSVTVQYTHTYMSAMACDGREQEGYKMNNTVKSQHIPGLQVALYSYHEYTQVE